MGAKLRTPFGGGHGNYSSCAKSRRCGRPPAGAPHFLYPTRLSSGRAFSLRAGSAFPEGARRLRATHGHGDTLGWSCRGAGVRRNHWNNFGGRSHDESGRSHEANCAVPRDGAPSTQHPNTARIITSEQPGSGRVWRLKVTVPSQ